MALVEDERWWGSGRGGFDPGSTSPIYGWTLAATSAERTRVTLKTQGVKDLVVEVVASLPASERGAHAIRNVFIAIEQHPDWRARYDLECSALGHAWVVNNWIGKWTRHCVGHGGTKQQVALDGYSLATSYSVLG